MSPDLRDQLQSTLGPGYRLSRELGGGGMAKVFVADDAALGRRVVVKVLSPELAAGVNLERFKREIHVAGKLHHPRIVSVLNAGQSDDIVYYTMPFIEGESLRALIAREQQLSVERALAIARDVAEALEYAHAQNIVHRDIKPDNILIERASGRAVVTDFGIARAIERAADILSVTSTGFTLGTPTYMSPEQAAAERHIDGRSDIYSLGCVLYEMLAGVPPFTGPTARAIIARHLNEPPPSIRIVRPDIAPGLQALLEKMLAKAPAGRQESVTRLRAELALPPTALAPASRRRIEGSAVVVAAAMLLAAALGIALAVRDRRSPEAPPAAASAAARIAVLYLDAPSDDRALVAVARGITRDLIGTLERVPDLSVISELGIRRFSPQTAVDSVARALGVGTVVYGTLEAVGDTALVDVHLADAASLAERGEVRARYPRAKLLSLRDTVVQEVARRLLPRIGQQMRLREWQAATRSSTAWELRQRAQELIDNEQEMPRRPADFGPQLMALAAADSLLSLAMRADPSWTDPPIARAWIRYERADYLPYDRAGSVLDSAVSIADEVLQREPSNARALEVRGVERYKRWSTVPGSPDSLRVKAETDLRSALLLDPHLVRAWSTLSFLLDLKGDAAGAAEAAQRAAGADFYRRDASQILMRLVFRHLYSGQADSARALCGRAMATFPSDAYVQSCELSVLGWSGRGSADLAAVRAALARTEESGKWPLVAGTFPVGRFWVAAVAARSGLRDTALAIVHATRSALRTAGHAHEFELNEAQVYALLGDRDAALSLLEDAVRYDASLRTWIARLPWFDALRSEPRYRRLVGLR